MDIKQLRYFDAIVKHGKISWAANAFYFVENRIKQPFIDFSIFSNKAYIGTVIANFLMNTTVGSIALFNIYTQSELDLTPFEAGLITLPYVCLLYTSPSPRDRG